MTAIFRILVAISFQHLIVTAAPVGICLHASSPDAPAEKIECFEFIKVERVGSDYRFFPSSDKSVLVTAYRFRGTITYHPDLAPTHPDFNKLLKLYEETARATPSTRPFLNHRILAMRGQAAEAAKRIENVAQLPTITLADGSQLKGCTMTKVEDGFVSIRHQDGVMKVNVKDLDAVEKNALSATNEGWSLEEPSVVSKDSEGTFAKIVFKNGQLLKKAKFKEVSDGNLIFLAEDKSVSIPADQFPGDLSLLGEEAMTALAKAEKGGDPEPPVVSSGNEDSPSAAVQSQHSNGPIGVFSIPDDDSPMPAEQGDASGQFDMGMRYAEGEGVGQDDAEAVKWFRKAAEQGNADAQFWLGAMYATGRGVRRDDVEAVKWYRKASEQGNAGAQVALGDMYAKGRGVRQDEPEAVKWFRKAAEQGNADAQVMLGVMYARGSGVTQDDAKAVKWFREAAEQGNALGQSWLGLSFAKGRGVPQQDDAEAAKWFHKAAEQGNVDAQFELGMKYVGGEGLQKDDAEAVKWFNEAAGQGNVNAQAMLGAMYAGGSGVRKDEVEAVKWYRKAAEQGHVLGQLSLGIRYAGGHGVRKDEVEAVNWLRKAAEQGNADAQAMLEAMYVKSSGERNDEVEAEMPASQEAVKGNIRTPFVVDPEVMMLVIVGAIVAFVIAKRLVRGKVTKANPLPNSKVSYQEKSKLKHPTNSQTGGVKFLCPHCGVKISAGAEDAGAAANCPSCGGELVVPTAITEGLSEIQHPLTPVVAQGLPPVPGKQPGKKKIMKTRILVLIAVTVVGGFVVINQVKDTDLNNPDVVKKIEKEAVDTSALQSRSSGGETLLYVPNGKKPYTGWMKGNSSDGGLELTQIENGLLDGVYVYYYKNGQKKLEGINKNGKKNGKQSYWYENGQKESELIFRDGNVSDLVVKYKPNGQKCLESKVEKGNGRSVLYDEDGIIIATYTYESGIIGVMRFIE